MEEGEGVMDSVEVGEGVCVGVAVVVAVSVAWEVEEWEEGGVTVRVGSALAVLCPAPPPLPPPMVREGERERVG